MEVRQEVRQEGGQEQVQEEQGVDERVEQGEAEELAAVDESLLVTNESDETEIRFIKGKGNRNLGKIISGNQQFVCNKRVKCKSEKGGTSYYYDCARNMKGKGKDLDLVARLEQLSKQMICVSSKNGKTDKSQPPL